MQNILILSKDPSLFENLSNCFIGDSRKRHIFYADRLRQKYPGSEIRIITYTSRSIVKRVDIVSEGLRLYGTRSYHRATYSFDLIKCLPVVLADGWTPNVVTVQTPWEEGLIGCLVARWLRARFVPQLHFDLFSVDWAAESFLNPLRRFIAKIVLRSADRVRVVSKSLRDKVVDECNISVDKVRIAPVGVNFIPAIGLKKDFKARLSPGLEQSKTVLFVGRLCPSKNLNLWYEVATRVLRNIPKVTFIIVGDGPEEFLFKSRVLAAGLQDHFIFSGNQAHEVLPFFYASADLFLLTSHYEGFGRVVLESLLSGVPVVSTACGGPQDLIDNGQSGYLVPCGDINGLADRVIELLDNDQSASLMGIAGQKIMMNQFSLLSLTDRMIGSWVE